MSNFIFDLFATYTFLQENLFCKQIYQLHCININYWEENECLNINICKVGET